MFFFGCEVDDSQSLENRSYRLTWNDEFEGNSINTDNWCHEMGNHGWGNNELQNYTDSAQNSFIDDGKLVIEAREESSGGSSYSSARMITLNKHAFAHGRIDIRAIIPEGQGVWPG
jgi:beta-glucanase (GH16 family)